jgi:hypothetical protein
MERMRALHSAGSIFGGAPILVENCFGLKIRHWRVAFGVRPRHFIPIQLPCWESYSYLESCTNCCPSQQLRGFSRSLLEKGHLYWFKTLVCTGYWTGTNHPVHMWRSICTEGDTLYKCEAEPRPSTNVSSFLRRGRGHLYWVEVPPDTNDVFFLFSNVFA